MNTDDFFFAFLAALIVSALTFVIWFSLDQHTKLSLACIERQGTYAQGVCIYGGTAP